MIFLFLGSFSENHYSLDLELDFLQVFSFMHRILANWLKVKFMGDDISDDTCRDAGGIQTLALFNALSSKGNQTISVSVCIKVSDNHFLYLLL